MSIKRVRIASRASLLALWQANHVRERLLSLHPELEIEIVKTTTSGDRIQTIALSEFGGMGAFTKEVQAALLDHQADIAVHSLKDLPTESHPHLTLAAVPQRAARNDVLILSEALQQQIGLQQDDEHPVLRIPEGRRIGTGSLRRRAMLKSLRPDLHYLEIRGNVDTRLQKLAEGQYDAIILAEAGLTRLEYNDIERTALLPPLMWPAVGQGALGIECRKNDVEVQELLAELNHAETFTEVLAERSLLRTLEAGCHAPVGVWCEVTEEGMQISARVVSHDGRTIIEQSVSGNLAQPAESGINLAQMLLKEGADQLIAATE